MSATLFNLTLLAGWLLVMIGAVMLNPGAGLAVAGLLLIALVFAVARIAGIYVPGAEKTGQQD